MFNDKNCVTQEFSKERPPTEAKPKKKKNKKKPQVPQHFNKNKNDGQQKDGNSENKKASNVDPEPLIKKTKNASKPGPTLPLDEIDFDKLNVKVIKRESDNNEDVSKKNKRDRKGKKPQRALGVERIIPDIGDTFGSEENEYIAKIRRLNEQKEAAERSTDLVSDIDENSVADDDDDDTPKIDPRDPFYLPSFIESNTEEVSKLFHGKIEAASTILSRNTIYYNKEKVEALMSFLGKYSPEYSVILIEFSYQVGYVF